MKLVCPPPMNGALHTISALLVAIFLTSCGSTKQVLPPDSAIPYNSGKLLEGDVIRVTFPGVANATEEAPIPASGKINLAFAGEYEAAGKTIAELEAEILEKYGKQLKVPEVTITLVSSSASIYVSGAVLRPGKFPLNRPLTLVQAIMEAGGPSADRARLDNVQLVRYEDGVQWVYRINVKQLMKQDTQPVYLRPGDVITVPVRVVNL